MNAWNKTFADSSALLATLRDATRKISLDDWPEISLLQDVVERAGIHTASGLPLRLVPPQTAGTAEPYELRLYQQGELEFRERNWHDLLNLLVWLTFPRAKAALNAGHHAVLATSPAVLRGVRGPVRDALTLFDESGIIVLSANPGLLDLIQEFRWKALFCAHRAQVISAMRFIPFGHALCEKALAPYRGLTGRALLLKVEPEVIDLAPVEQLQYIDRRTAMLITSAQALQTPSALAPLPVLGVPGWCADNENPDYYDDHDHFRPGRLRIRKLTQAADSENKAIPGPGQ